MRRLPRSISVLAYASFAMLYLPIVVVAVFSVNDSWRGQEWRGFTLRWYVRVFQDEQVLAAAGNTLWLAGVSTLLATLLGTLLALGMERAPWSRSTLSLMDLSLHLPVVTPDIILAASLVVAFRVLRGVWDVFDPGLFTMILGHVTFQIPFVALVVRGRLRVLGSSLDEAAHDLYARGGALMRRLTLPLLAPGIAAGAMLAFTLSLDDFVISFFTASPRSTTLPILIYSELRRGVTAGTHALSTMIFLVTVMLVLGIGLLMRRCSAEKKP